MLDSFPSAMNVAVIGASGGIGRSMTELLAADDRTASVVALARDPGAVDLPGVRAAYIDLEDEASIETAAAIASSDGSLDLVVMTTGILWQGDAIQPEKSMREIRAASLERLFAINATGPALVARHFLPQLRKGAKSVFAALSARVGSISDNRLGGWYGYRASKAALNMLLKTLAIEHARRFPDSIVAGLHPGTVDTGLSRPFTGRTPADRILTSQQSAQYLLEVIDGLEPGDSGGVFAWDGSRIEY